MELGGRVSRRAGGWMELCGWVGGQACGWVCLLGMSSIRSQAAGRRLRSTGQWSVWLPLHRIDGRLQPDYSIQ